MHARTNLWKQNWTSVIISYECADDDRSSSLDRRERLVAVKRVANWGMTSWSRPWATTGRVGNRGRLTPAVAWFRCKVRVIILERGSDGWNRRSWSLVGVIVRPAEELRWDGLPVNPYEAVGPIPVDRGQNVAASGGASRAAHTYVHPEAFNGPYIWLELYYK